MKGFLDKLVSDSNKRFFKIKSVKGSQAVEHTLVYSESPKDIDDQPKGKISYQLKIVLLCYIYNLLVCAYKVIMQKKI